MLYSPHQPETDPDAARDAWHDVQDNDKHLAWLREQNAISAEQRRLDEFHAEHNDGGRLSFLG